MVPFVLWEGATSGGESPCALDTQHLCGNILYVQKINTFNLSASGAP